MEKLDIINTEDETKTEMRNGIKRLLSLDYEIKGLQEDKKEVKREMKEKGVDVAIANKIVTILKRKEKEKKDMKLAEALDYAEEFSEDKEIDAILNRIFEE